MLSLSLYIVWARMNAELELIVYHINGKKYVDSAGDYIE